MDIHIEHAIRLHHIQENIITECISYLRNQLNQEYLMKFICDELDNKYTDKDIQCLKHFITIHDFSYIKEIDDLDLLNDVYGFINQSYYKNQYEEVKQFIDKYNKKHKK